MGQTHDRPESHRNDVTGDRPRPAKPCKSNSGADIARYLNDHEMLRDGKTWNCDDVRKVLACPRYAGWSVWNRTTLQLHSRRRRVAPEKWIMRAGAIPPIVDQATFDRAQDTLRKHADRSWSDEDILREMKRLLKAKGRLSACIIGKTRGVPSPTTIRTRLGSLAKMYELIGYRYHPYDFYQGHGIIRRWLYDCVVG